MGGKYEGKDDAAINLHHLFCILPDISHFSAFHASLTVFPQGQNISHQQLLLPIPIPWRPCLVSTHFALTSPSFEIDIISDIFRAGKLSPRNYFKRVTATASFRSYSHCCPLGRGRGTGGSDRLRPKQCWVFAQCLCFFCFCLQPKLISRSPSFIK